MDRLSIEGCSVGQSREGRSVLTQDIAVSTEGTGPGVAEQSIDTATILDELHHSLESILIDHRYELCRRSRETIDRGGGLPDGLDTTLAQKGRQRRAGG